MILISDLRQEILLREVKENYVDVQIYKDCIYWWLPNKESCCEPLPPGSWKIDGICSEVGEDVWDNIIQNKTWILDSGYTIDESYRDYCDPQQIVSSEYTLNTALESGLSLVKSKNLNAERTLLITEK